MIEPNYMRVEELAMTDTMIGEPNPRVTGRVGQFSTKAILTMGYGHCNRCGCSGYIEDVNNKPKCMCGHQPSDHA